MLQTENTKVLYEVDVQTSRFRKIVDQSMMTADISEILRNDGHEYLVFTDRKGTFALTDIDSGESVPLEPPPDLQLLTVLDHRLFAFTLEDGITVAREYVTRQWRVVTMSKVRFERAKDGRFVESRFEASVILGTGMRSSKFLWFRAREGKFGTVWLSGYTPAARIVEWFRGGLLVVSEGMRATNQLAGRSRVVRMPARDASRQRIDFSFVGRYVNWPEGCGFTD